MTKILLEARRPRTKRLLGAPDAALCAVRSKQSLIRWPTEQEILKVSKQLLRIQQVGIRCEAGGDFFRSGDLAYQIQEIIRATAELSRKGQRAKG
jgi:hypothetical protein